MKKRIIFVVFIIFFLIVGALVYFGQKSNREKELVYSGTIDAIQANLSFQVAGRVSQVFVQEGQSVSQNQMIAELDRSEFESRFEQARANLERAQKTRRQLETVLELSRKTLPAEVARAKAGVQSAKDSLKDAEKNYRRFEELFGKNVVSEKERDALNKKIEVWNEALQGKDGSGGKKKVLADHETAFKDKCWTQKVKHDSKFQGAFEGVRASAE